MPCEVIRIPGERGLTVCTRGPHRRRANCADCDREYVALCDYPVGPRGRTCNRRMCNDHRTRGAGDDVDYCKRHARVVDVRHVAPAPPLQMALGLG